MAGNPWLAHLKSFWAKNKTKMSYRQAMVQAKKTYTKVGSSGAKKKKRRKK
jgi:hypothetical protein